MKLISIIASLLLPAIAIEATAQNDPAKKDTALKGSTIEIIQSYNPQVKQSSKPEWTPGLPPTDTSRPAFSYFVPPQTLLYTYSARPLRPLALGRDSLDVPYPDYVKIGAGNLSTLYLDAGFGGLHSKDVTSAIHLHYLSQKGTIQYQQSSLAGIEAEATMQRSNSVWHAMVNGERNQFYYYGYNHDMHVYPGDSVKQTYTGIGGAIDVLHTSRSLPGFSYHPSVTASFYGDQYSAAETTIGLELPFFYDIDTTIRFKVALSGIFTRYAAGGNTQNNNILQVVPGMSVHSGPFTGHAYLSPAFGQNNNFYFLPDVVASYRVAPGMFTVSAGWQAMLRQNTYAELSTENPYMFDSYAVRQTRRDEVFGNVETNVGNHFTISARLSWWQFSELPLFLNNTGDQRKFYIVYDDKVNAISVKGMIRYQIANTLSLGFNASVYNYYNSTTLHVWHQPAVIFKGDVLFHPVPSLTVTAYLSALQDIYALDAQNNPVKLNSIFDLGGNIEYNIIPRLSVFLQLTNLLNDKYQRWLGYNAYGINVYGGLRLKF